MANYSSSVATGPGMMGTGGQGMQMSIEELRQQRAQAMGGGSVMPSQMGDLADQMNMQLPMDDMGGMPMDDNASASMMMPPQGGMRMGGPPPGVGMGMGIPVHGMGMGMHRPMPMMQPPSDKKDSGASGVLGKVPEPARDPLLVFIVAALILLPFVNEGLTKYIPQLAPEKDGKMSYVGVGIMAAIIAVVYGALKWITNKK